MVLQKQENHVIGLGRNITKTSCSPSRPQVETCGPHDLHPRTPAVPGSADSRRSNLSSFFERSVPPVPRPQQHRHRCQILVWTRKAGSRPVIRLRCCEHHCLLLGCCRVCTLHQEIERSCDRGGRCCHALSIAWHLCISPGSLTQLTSDLKTQT